MPDSAEALSTSPKDALMWIVDRPLTFVRGEGSWIHDDAGRRYLDFVQGWAVNALGHSPAVIREALARQAASMIHCSADFYNPCSIRLAQALVRSSVFDRVFFANSGAEANEGAIKLARKWGTLHRDGAFEIITFKGGFHGRTLAAMSASGKPQFRSLFEPKVPGFHWAELNDIASVERLMGPRTVAVMLEPIQGESGVIEASDAFMRELRTLTRARGLLLIVDEVQTGIGRTGRMFAYEHSGIEPDIMTLGKGLGGGVPLAALLAKQAVSVFEAGDQGGTFCGNALMTAVGAAVVDVVSDPVFITAVRARSVALTHGLERISARHGLGSVRGRGLLLALALGKECAGRIVREARERGLLVNAPQADTLRFMPALNVSDEEIGRACGILDEAIAAVV